MQPVVEHITLQRNLLSQTDKHDMKRSKIDAEERCILLSIRPPNPAGHLQRHTTRQEHHREARQTVAHLKVIIQGPPVKRQHQILRQRDMHQKVKVKELGRRANTKPATLIDQRREIDLAEHIMRRDFQQRMMVWAVTSM